MDNPTKKKFKGVKAAPDDLIYSQGWTIGFASPSRRLTKSSQKEDSENQGPCTPSVPVGPPRR